MLRIKSFQKLKYYTAQGLDGLILSSKLREINISTCHNIDKENLESYRQHYVRSLLYIFQVITRNFASNFRLSLPIGITSFLCTFSLPVVKCDVVSPCYLCINIYASLIIPFGFQLHILVCCKFYKRCCQLRVDLLFLERKSFTRETNEIERGVYHVNFVALRIIAFITDSKATQLVSQVSYYTKNGSCYCYPVSTPNSRLSHWSNGGCEN